MASASRLLEEIRQFGSVLVAFSGGADSALVLAASVRALGADRVVAATAVSPSLAQQELEPASAFARDLGVAHLFPETHEGDRPGYVANGADRCYFCKAELLDVLAPLAGDATVLTGTNADDVRDRFRPGIRAAAERGAHAPLAAAGLTKDDVRALSHAWGLPTWDKPAAACLASRIAYGVEVTPRRLARVDRAELVTRDWLARRGLVTVDLRVRDLGTSARVEVDAALVPSLRGTDLPAVLAGEGLGDVVIEAFRSGSMNEALSQ